MDSTLLDLVLSRNEDGIVELVHKPCPYKSDHDIIFFKIVTEVKAITKKRTLKCNYSKADHAKIAEGVYSLSKSVGFHTADGIQEI